MSRGYMRMGIRTQMRMSGAGRAKSEAQSVSREYKQLDLFMKEVETKQRGVQMWQYNALTYVSTLQLARFSLKDIQDIASGKGGIGDMLSLTTSLILLHYNLNRILQTNIALTGTLQAMSAAVGGPGALGLIAGTLIGSAAIGGLALAREQQMAPIRAERAMRQQAASAIGIQQNLSTQLEQRRNIQNLRAMGMVE